MIRTEVVAWADPRVAALHEALFAEMGALYAPLLDPLTPEDRTAAVGSLAIDPDAIEVTLLMLDGDLPVATGALRRTADDPATHWDVKRVFVVESHRGRGLSRELMVDLEQRARDAGATTMVLETGAWQPAAHGLYEGLGYERTEAYAPYGHFPQERFYRKAL